MNDNTQSPSKEAEMIAEAIGHLRGEDDFAVTEYGPAQEGYVTLLEGDKLYPAMFDYYPEDDIADGELITNDLFEELLPHLSFDTERAPVPRSVIREQRRLLNEINDGDADE